MKTISVVRCFVALIALSAASAAVAAPPDHWVGTWATASVDNPNRPHGGAPDAPVFLATDTSVREIVHVSLGGGALRVDLTNEFGTEPLTVIAASIAPAGAKGELAAAPVALTFGGSASIIIPPAAHVVSDAATLNVPVGSDLAITIFLPAQKLTHLTQHNSAYQTNYIIPGNVTAEKTLPGEAKTFANWYFLKQVSVRAGEKAASVVAFGDSITDGTYSTADTNRRWPDFLARRLAADKKTSSLGVLNEGIGGNRVLHDGTGPSALARFDEDVLALDGVKYVILLEAINDIGHAKDPVRPYDVVSAQDLIQGYSQLIERAHEHGIQVIGATLTPYLGAKYASPEGEAMRKEVNQFIRTSKLFDGVIDFEAATMDKSTGAFDAKYDHGDHLHPTDAGMEAMANAIDLKLFTEK